MKSAESRNQCVKWWLRSWNIYYNIISLRREPNKRRENEKKKNEPKIRWNSIEKAYFVRTRIEYLFFFQRFAAHYE